jgi:hypothetical protein
MNPDSPEFKALRAKWYARLARAGFKDAEVVGHHQDFIKNPVTRHLYGGAKEGRGFHAGVRREYYEAAQDWYRRNKKWISPLHKKVWKLHSEGMTGREIDEKLGLAPEKAKSCVRQVRQAMKRASNGR